MRLLRWIRSALFGEEEEEPMPRQWTEEETRPFSTGWREAEVRYVYDADTPRLMVDVGFGVCMTSYIRVLAEGAALTPRDKSDDGFDAWELRGDERPLGIEAKARALELIPVGSTVRVWSLDGKGRRGKYRWLGVVLYKEGDRWISLADTLILEGHDSRSAG